MIHAKGEGDLVSSPAAGIPFLGSPAYLTHPLKGNAVQQTQTMTVEIEGEEKPALVADWLTRAVYA